MPNRSRIRPERGPTPCSGEAWLRTQRTKHDSRSQWRHTPEVWVFRVLSGQEMAAGQKAHWIWEELPFCVPSVCEFYPCAQGVQNTDQRVAHTDKTRTRMKPSQMNASLPSLRKPASKTSDSSIQPHKTQKNRSLRPKVLFSWQEIRNPKNQIRRKHNAGNSARTRDARFRLGFISDFVFRISFGFGSSDFLPGKQRLRH